MRIKEVITVNEDFSGQIVAADPVISEEDTARILAVKESDWSAPMTGEELMAHLAVVVGKQ
jgi:hypothetical protein